jgi:Domain of unknown function (DUF6894)
MNDVQTDDFEGRELVDLESARIEAQKDIQNIKNTHFNAFDGNWSNWSIEICDRDRALLLIVPFSGN